MKKYIKLAWLLAIMPGVIYGASESKDEPAVVVGSDLRQGQSSMINDQQEMNNIIDCLIQNIKSNDHGLFSSNFKELMKKFPTFKVDSPLKSEVIVSEDYRFNPTLLYYAAIKQADLIMDFLLQQGANPLCKINMKPTIGSYSYEFSILEKILELNKRGVIKIGVIQRILQWLSTKKCEGLLSEEDCQRYDSIFHQVWCDALDKYGSAKGSKLEDKRDWCSFLYRLTNQSVDQKMQDLVIHCSGRISLLVKLLQDEDLSLSFSRPNLEFIWRQAFYNRHGEDKKKESRRLMQACIKKDSTIVNCQIINDSASHCSGNGPNLPDTVLNFLLQEEPQYFDVETVNLLLANEATQITAEGVLQLKNWARDNAGPIAARQSIARQESFIGHLVSAINSRFSDEAIVLEELPRLATGCEAVISKASNKSSADASSKQCGAANNKILNKNIKLEKYVNRAFYAGLAGLGISVVWYGLTPYKWYGASFMKSTKPIVLLAAASVVSSVVSECMRKDY